MVTRVKRRAAVGTHALEKANGPCPLFETDIGAMSLAPRHLTNTIDAIGFVPEELATAITARALAGRPQDSLGAHPARARRMRWRNHTRRRLFLARLARAWRANNSAGVTQVTGMLPLLLVRSIRTTGRTPSCYAPVHCAM